MRAGASPRRHSWPWKTSPASRRKAEDNATQPLPPAPSPLRGGGERPCCSPSAPPLRLGEGAGGRGWGTDSENSNIRSDSRILLAVRIGTMILCPFCHFQNEDGALFCEQCKSDLSGVEPSKSGAGEPIPVAAVLDETVPMAATIEGGKGVETVPMAQIIAEAAAAKAGAPAPRAES